MIFFLFSQGSSCQMWSTAGVLFLLFFCEVDAEYNYLTVVNQHFLRNSARHEYPYTAPQRVLDRLNTSSPPRPPVQFNEHNPEGFVGGPPDPIRGGFSTGRPNNLQVVHPAPPNEEDWVLTAGNETLVDNVLAISLNYGGRLVSMGYYLANGGVNYYAIMHKYSGPVFIKPGPMTFDELIKAVRENELRDLALTQVCGQEEKPGKVTFSTYWEKVPGVEMQVWFPGSDHSDTQRKHFEKQGMRLTYLCGYSEGGKGKYVGVWQKPSLGEKTQYEAHYGLTMDACMHKDKMLTKAGYVATSFRVFNNKRQVLCTGIWELRPGKKSHVTRGTELQAMYRNFQRDPRMIPRQVSHYLDNYGQIIYVVLWSDLHSNRYPNPKPLWDENEIPIRYLKGSPELLKENQMDFLVRRVEYFMKDLNIPGLSIAISKKEKLKFAAGFGFADVREEEPVTPNHQFRIGSVSKPVTAAAIMLLIDRGYFKLDDKLFGKQGIFGTQFSKRRAYRKYVTDVTIRNLLEHTSGGWDNLASDAAWIEPEMTTKELIEHVLENVPLEYKPGTQWIYSNFGYQVLGYIIEHYSGMSYENFVKKHIFNPSGVYDIQIARPTISDQAPREVLYYMSGTGIGFNPYEMLPPDRIGPWGGWIASPIQLLMFMSRVDGFPYREDILSPTSVVDWETPSKASNDTYGLGWSLNIMGFNGWQHDGRMPGSAAMVVRLDNGLTMAVTVNKEYSERDFFHELGYVLHHVGNNCDWWNGDEDLFQAN